MSTPDPLTFIVHSSPKYSNNTMFDRAMDENLARWHIVRVIVEECASVAMMAMRWCKRNNIRLTLVVVDITVAQREDRKRRYQYMADERPDVVLVFDTPLNLEEFTSTIYVAGCPISLVYPKNQLPYYATWKKGMTKMPFTINDASAARDARLGRPKKKMTPEEKKNAEKRSQEKSAERKRIAKLLTKAMKPVKGYTSRRRVL
jgi:hypothetical protein